MPRTAVNEKTNPNVALTEAVGMEQWQSGMGPDYTPLVAKDIYGRAITEPDLSNPTRSRFERPLDTIRAFEAAAYDKDFGAAAEGGPETPRNASRLSVRGYPGHPGAGSRRESMQRSSSGYSQRQSTGNGNGQYAYGPSGAALGEAEEASYSPAHWDVRHSTGPIAPQQQQQNPYGSPVSDTGRASVQYGQQPQARLPVQQKLNYQTPPTPPQEKKKSILKRMSFGKSKQ